jgi:hypothetical protein
MIIQAAHAMNAGRQPDFRAQSEMQRDVFFIPRSDPAAVVDEIVELAASRLPVFYDADPLRDVQVLSPIYKGPVGYWGPRRVTGSWTPSTPSANARSDAMRRSPSCSAKGA